MRRLLVALALIGLITPAAAGDYDEIPMLRGTYVPAPPKFVRWSGFYVGAFAGYADAHFDFSHATRSLVADILRNSTLEDVSRPSLWKVLGTKDVHAGTFGGFVGYNSQWDDLVVSIEANYNRFNVSATAPSNPLTRVNAPGDGSTYTTTVSGSAAMHLFDYGSLRLRAGWLISNFMPYVTAGFALGRADYARSATVQGTYTTTGSATITAFGPWSETDGKPKAILPGWSAGAGVDVAVMPNLFLRAEYEFVRLGPVGGITIDINAVRAGAAVKF